MLTAMKYTTGKEIKSGMPFQALDGHTKRAATMVDSADREHVHAQKAPLDSEASVWPLCGDSAAPSRVQAWEK